MAPFKNLVGTLACAILVACAVKGTRSLIRGRSAVAASGDDAYWQVVRGEGMPGTPYNVRRYFIQAEEVEWDYAPKGTNIITGLPFGDSENVYVQNGPDRIGSKYIKCLYRGYTDGTFTKRTPLSPDQGFRGPIIRAEVGDRVEIVYKNTCSFDNSVHVHGLFYLKNAEGAPYDDKTPPRDKLDDAVRPGDSYEYRWDVPEQAGPGPGDGTSVAWLYHSHTNEVKDTYAGLVGVLTVARRGSARPDGSPADVDREVVLFWLVMNENLSPYIADNVKRFVPGEARPDLIGDPGFIESNLMHNINGFVYGNHPIIGSRRSKICIGARVRWYVIGFGNEVDLHTPHWHANTVVVSHGQRTDVVNLLPATMLVADQVPYNPGLWLLHCHVNDHITAGMSMLFRVLKC